MKFNTLVRKMVNTHNNCPVKIIPGKSRPRLVGQKYHWKTKGGSIINHPSAYSKNGWSNMVYVRSTICVEVGENWKLPKGLNLNK